MGKDANYDIIYRGEVRNHISPGKWVFIQRAKEYGGGFWLGRAYEDCFWIEYEKPTSLIEGIEFIFTMERMHANFNAFDDDFDLE